MQNQEPEGLGKILRLIRNNRGLSLREVAAVLGITHSYYACFEKGTRRIQLENLIAFSRFMGVSIQDIVDEAECFPEIPAYLRGLPGKIMKCLLLMDDTERQQALHYANSNLQAVAEKEKAFECLDDVIKGVMYRVMCADPEGQAELYDYLQKIKTQNIAERRLKTRKEKKEREKA